MVSFSAVSFTSAIVAALCVSSVVARPAATATTKGLATRPRGLNAATHSVIAGLGGLHFDPENVVAEIGDIVEFHYLPKNHSVVQSSFGAPCQPNDNAFFSGFMPTPEGQNPNVFQITVTTKDPIWYFCSQVTHCQMGMAGVINQNFDGPNTLSAYKAAAALTTVSSNPPAVAAGANLGQVIANPNPLGGF